MVTRVAVVALMVLLCASPAAAGDDVLHNQTTTLTPDGSSNLTDNSDGSTVSTIEETVRTVAAEGNATDRPDSKPARPEKTVRTVTDAVNATPGADMLNLSADTLSTLETTEEGDPLAVNNTLVALLSVDDTIAVVDDALASDLRRIIAAIGGEEAPTAEDDGGTDGSAAPAIVPPSRDGTGGAAVSVGSAGARPDDDTIPDGLPVAVGTGALLVGLAARGTTLVGGSATSPSGTVRRSAGWLRAELDRLLRVLVPLRYSRYDGSDPLEHEDRARLMNSIESNPGTYLTGLANAVDVPLSTARHHLKVLEREGLIERAVVRGKRRLFPAHSESQALAAALADESTAAVIDALARIGPCSTSELADELDRHTSTMSHHLQRLEADDLIVRERDGRAQVARLSPDIAEMLTDEWSEASAASSASPAD